MNDIKIILDGIHEIDVKGIFYIYNSKYYLIYTLNELDENDYVELYIVQVCKEIQNTPSGRVDTGYMLGLEINNPDEWKDVQDSITKIVENKKGNITGNEIQYLPSTMLSKLKIISKNKFKLIKSILENNFEVIISPANNNEVIDNTVSTPNDVVLNENIQNNLINNSDLTSLQDLKPQSTNEKITGEVVIDYRTRFFEEQEKNKILEEQIKNLNQKIESLKNILG